MKADQEIAPSDSASSTENGLYVKTRSSVTSAKSKANSSTLSARLAARAKKAVLEAERAELIKRHALEQEEFALKRKSRPKPSFGKVTGCQSKHSTYLHPRNDTRVAEKSSGPDVPWRSVGESDNGTTVDNNGVRNSCVNAAKAEFSAIGAGVSVTGLPVVPVKVKCAGSSKVIETYAFLNPGSDTTFCTNELLEQLGVEGKETILSLTTLQQEDQTTRCNMMSLVVFDLDEENLVELPIVFSTERLPVSESSISLQKDVDRWLHLKDVKL